MGLIVKDITVIGFGSYGETPQRLTLGGQGPVAVIGENGAGKSTIVSKALTWCLYGKTAPDRMGGGTKVLRGDAVIAEGCQTAEVVVRLTDNRMQSEYTVKRSKTRKHGDALTITRTDKNGDHDIDPSQTAVEGLIGVNYETFTRTVVRGQGDLWAFAEATDGKKREVLDAISGAALLDEAHARAVAIRKTQAAKLADLSRRADDLTNRARDQRSRVAGLKSQHSTWETEREDRIKAAQADVEAAAQALEDAQTVDMGRAAIQAQHEALKAAEPTLDLQPYRDAVGDAYAALLATSKALSAAESDLRRFEGLIPGADCPTCGHPIAADGIVSANRKAAQDAVDKHRPQAMDAQEHHTKCVKAQQAAVQWLNAQQVQHRANQAALPPIGGERTPVAQLALQSAKNRLHTVEGADNPFTVAMIEAKQQQRDLLRETFMLRAMEVEAQRELSRAEAWESALHPRGARAHMASAALAAVERAACEWLTVLSGNRMSVEFPEDTNREKIGTVVTMDGAVRDLLTFSGGERRRVNMAVDLGVSSAFARGGLALSLLVMDEEVFSGMDEAGKAAVVHALHGAGVADVVVVDHDPRLSAVLPRCVEIVRGTDGYSAVKEG